MLSGVPVNDRACKLGLDPKGDLRLASSELFIELSNDRRITGALAAGVPMATATSFRVGGPADVFLDAAGPDDVLLAVEAAKRRGVPYHVIGWGTNLLVRDGGIRGLVVRIGPAMAYTAWDEGSPAVVAGAGVHLRALSAAAAERGLTGLEFAEGIPGSLGGALVMNAGAYDGEIGPLVDWVDVLDLGPDGGRRRLTQPQLDYSYRHSALQGAPLAVLEARIVLTPGDPDQIRQRMAELAERRRQRQPLEYPSAGSYFMRPHGHFAGPMIEECGLKGYRVGGAEVSTKHANFIINTGGATAADVLAVAEHVRRTVKDRFGVELQPEVRVIGEAK